MRQRSIAAWADSHYVRNAPVAISDARARRRTVSPLGEIVLPARAQTTRLAPRDEPLRSAVMLMKRSDRDPPALRRRERIRPVGDAIDDVMPPTATLV